MAVSDVSFEKMGSSQYIRPIRMRFLHDGVRRAWDMTLSHDCVSCLLLHVERNAFVFVRQFRPAVFASSAYRETGSVEGVDWARRSVAAAETLELCAGIVDKDKPLEEVVQDEIVEECGFRVPLDRLQRITACLDHVGTGGTRQTLFYAEVGEGDRVSAGGGCATEHEAITVEYVRVDEALKMLGAADVPLSPVGLLFALGWWQQRRDAAANSRRLVATAAIFAIGGLCIGCYAASR